MTGRAGQQLAGGLQSRNCSSSAPSRLVVRQQSSSWSLALPAVIRRAWPRRLACALTASALRCRRPAARARPPTGSVRLRQQAGSPTAPRCGSPSRRWRLPRSRSVAGVRLSGTITNRSQETWSNLNVYLVTSQTPIRSRRARRVPRAPTPTRRSATGAPPRAPSSRSVTSGRASRSTTGSRCAARTSGSRGAGRLLGGGARARRAGKWPRQRGRRPGPHVHAADARPAERRRAAAHTRLR